MLCAYILAIMESLSRNIQKENLQSPAMRRHDISLGYDQEHLAKTRQDDPSLPV